jgi:predicted dithiol-disulfide oxidoreductase (DUF899 family)
MAVSRAPLSSIQAFKRRMGWSFPWASAAASDFNFDFNMSLTEEQQRAGDGSYNYQPLEPMTPPREEGPVADFAHSCGVDVAAYTRERPGMSAFALADGAVHHTYTTYARGLDALWGMYQWLDRAPKGRNEPVNWWRRHDEYDAA